MVLTLISLMSILEDEVSPTLELYPQVGSPNWNKNHLNPQPDNPLTTKYSSDCLPWVPNHNHSFPLIYITFDVNPVLVRPHEHLWGPSYVFVHTNFNPLQYISTNNMSRVYQCNYVMGSLNLTSSMCHLILDLFPDILHLIMIPFLISGAWLGDSVKA